MIKIDGIQITDAYEEYGIQWPDGSQTWDLEDEDAKVIGWSGEGCTLLKRRVFLGQPEVAE